jgi:hypothetical protein
MSRSAVNLLRRKKVFHPLFAPALRRPGPSYLYGFHSAAHRRPGVVAIETLRHEDSPENKVTTKPLDETPAFKEDPK